VETTLKDSGGELLTRVLDIYSVLKKMRCSFGMVDIPYVCREPGLAASGETYPFLFMCLVA
jgi:hypothetical protein